MRNVTVAVWAAALAGLALLPCAAVAQTVEGRRQAATVDEPSRAASPYGARYIPGVGFRYVYSGAGPRVYGYYARGYRAKRCGGDRVWNGAGCVRARHWLW